MVVLVSLSEATAVEKRAPPLIEMFTGLDEKEVEIVLEADSTG